MHILNGANMDYPIIDITNLDRDRFEIDVVSYSLPKFHYNTLSPKVDENGEVHLVEVGAENQTINRAMFLYWLRTDKNTGEEVIEGIDAANAFLMDLLVNSGNKDVSIYSRGLIHYFTKLAEWQIDWHYSPATKSKRPLYRFRRFLEDSYRSKNPDIHIAASTAKAYMRAAVRFYKHYLSIGELFENKPFEYEQISIDIGTDETNISGSNKILVPTTDVRLKVPKQKAGKIPNKLKALSDHEFDLLERILCIERKVLKYQHGCFTECSLPVEFSLMFLLMRHCGLRREEALTINEEWILRGIRHSNGKSFVRLEIGPRVGIQTKNDKEREIEIPVPLLQQLHRYSLTGRYVKRRDKFISNITGDSWTPMFLNQNGFQIKKETVNARWSEIRHSLSEKLGYRFIHKVHNLRSTYATKRLFSLIDVGMKQSMALENVQSLLGHEELAITFHYLTQIEGYKEADELAEIALDYLYEITEAEGE